MKIELDLNPEQAEKFKRGIWEDREDMFIYFGKTIYFLKPDGIGISCWMYDGSDHDNISRDNVYSTRKSAEQADRQRLALGAIHNYVRENGIKMAGFNGYVPDWDIDEGEAEWQIVGWNFQENEPRCDFSYAIDVSSHGLIFATKEDRQKVIDNCKQELEDLLKVDYSIIR